MNIYYFLFLVHLCTVNCFKVLVVCPLPNKSHVILGDGLVKHLARAGHEVWYVSSRSSLNTTQPHVTLVNVSSSTEDFLTALDQLFNFEVRLKQKISLSDASNIMANMINVTGTIMKHPRFQAIMKDEQQTFDVIIAEWFHTELYAGLSSVFNCPFIWFSTVTPHWRILKLVDDASNPAYTSDFDINSFPPFSFAQRIKELSIQIYIQLLQKLYFHDLEEEIYNNILAPIILEKGRTPVPINELRYNASLVLGNSHVSLGVPFRLPENYKSIGGYHLDEDISPLPKDLEEVVNNSEHGVIYFSMGTNLKSKTLPTIVKQQLLEMFGELRQSVIWKFEEDLPNRPKNVYIMKWTPQASILAHPNCIIFITHGGLLSTTEAIHFGVPIIGIPVFGDQFSNIDTAVKKGFAKKINLSYTLATDLKIAINSILSNTCYKEKIKDLSFIYHHRPASPSSELVHWVQHVVKTRGAPHLRSPALMVPWYQKLFLDMIALIMMITILFIYILRFFIYLMRKKKTK